MQDDENNNQYKFTIFLNHFWTFVAFISMCVGALMIHPGLIWIFLGLYIIKMTFRTDGLFNIIITLPPIIQPSSNKLDDEFIKKYKNNINEIIETDENE